MPLYNQIAGAGIDEGDGDALTVPVGTLMNYGIIDRFGIENRARYNWLMLVATPRQKAEITSALSSLTNGPAVSGQLRALVNGSAVGSWFSDAFKGVQHFAAGMGMQVPRTAFLGLVAVNAFGYANKLWKAEQYTDTREKLQDIWWRLGGDEVKLREAIDIGKNKPAATTVSDQNQKLIQLASQGGTYTDAAGIKHDINTGAVVSGAHIGEVAVTAAIISSAAIIVAAIMPVISKMLDKHAAVDNTPVPGLPVNPSTGLPIGYTGNVLTEFIATNPIPSLLIGAGILYFVYEEIK